MKQSKSKSRKNHTCILTKTTLSQIRNLPKTCLLFLQIPIHYTGLNPENIL